MSSSSLQLHLWWIDGKTYVDFTRPWYAKIMPFPLNFFLPGRKQKAASLRVFLTKGGENINDSDVEAKVRACRRSEHFASEIFVLEQS